MTLFQRLSRVIRKLSAAFDVLVMKSKVSYSQCGEDMIAAYFFEQTNISKPIYIDIGANDPKRGSNTYYFYLRGSRGFCIEPDYSLIPDLKKYRPRDCIINAGVSIERSPAAKFYLFPGHYRSWNTFVENDAVKKMNESGIKFIEVQVPVYTLDDFIEKFSIGKVNFISLDAEGMDLQILMSLPYDVLRPELICVESIRFSTKMNFTKNKEIDDFMESIGYVLYAETGINSIFSRKDIIVN